MLNPEIIMKSLYKTFQNSMFLLVELVLYASLLGVNIYLGFEIYQSLITDIGTDVKLQGADAELVELPTINSEGLSSFEEDQQKKIEYNPEVDLGMLSRWEKFENKEIVF